MKTSDICKLGKCIDSCVLREGFEVHLSKESISFDIRGGAAIFYDGLSGEYSIPSSASEMMPIRDGDSWRFRF
ncbi:MAG: hypothetical protein OEL87_03185 [Nanoarchaeota archaeon]|nr:hypothetical protein [Nanoarchaeota archaeon]